MRANKSQKDRETKQKAANALILEADKMKSYKYTNRN